MQRETIKCDLFGNVKLTISGKILKTNKKQRSIIIIIIIINYGAVSFLTYTSFTFIDKILLLLLLLLLLSKKFK